MVSFSQSNRESGSRGLQNLRAQLWQDPLRAEELGNNSGRLFREYCFGEENSLSLTEFWGKLGEFCEELGEFAFTHK